MAPVEPPVILIVDDDASTRALYVATLKRADYKVISATNGQEAIDILGSTPVECMIIDSKMPILTGPEVIEQLRAEPVFSLLPIIMVTGSDEPSDMITGLNKGANDYLVKPVDPTELLARVRAQLRVSESWLDANKASLGRRMALVDTFSNIDPLAELDQVASAMVDQINAYENVKSACIYAFPRKDSALLLAGQANHPVGHDRDIPKNVTLSLYSLAERGPSLLKPGVDERWWSESNSDNVFSCPLGEKESPFGILIFTSRGAALREASGLSLLVDVAGIATTLLGPKLRRALGQAASAKEIRAAMKAPGTQIAYQPIVDLQSHQLVGFEALARFSDGVRPDHRLSDAAMAGIRDEIELELFRLAVDSCDHLPSQVWVSANLSAAVLVEHPGLGEVTRRSQRKLVVELTENEPVSDYEKVRTAIGSLAGEPLLSIDDAGAGYASLRHIFELSPAFVKLDREWVSGIDSDPIRQALVESLVIFSHRSGAKLVAEGIETSSELKTLANAGVNLGQGYLLGKPMFAPGEPPAIISSRLKNALDG